MAKGLPYFKFIVTEWLTGDIVYEEFDVQGLFINICAIYWQRNGELSLLDIEKRYKKSELIAKLTNRFFSVNNGLISIKFLDELLIEAGHISMINSQNGSLGGRPKSLKTLAKKPNAKRTKTEVKAKKSQEEEEVNKKKKFIPPQIEEIIKYCIENDYDAVLANKVFKYYSEANWHDSEGKQVLNWKQKLQAVWFKPENKPKHLIQEPKRVANFGKK